MRAISLWEPWASLIRTGAKTFETRSWETKYRGLLLICAAKSAGHRKIFTESDFMEFLARPTTQAGLRPLIGELIPEVLDVENYSQLKGKLVSPGVANREG